LNYWLSTVKGAEFGAFLLIQPCADEAIEDSLNSMFMISTGITEDWIRKKTGMAPRIILLPEDRGK
jgi:hypothetical protein